jgi:hypothetical protein
MIKKEGMKVWDCIVLCLGSSWALGSGMDDLEGWRGSMESESERLYYSVEMFMIRLVLVYNLKRTSV